MTDEALTIRFGLFAGLLALVVVIPNRASSSRIRNALGVLALTVSYLSILFLLLEVVLDLTLYAVWLSLAAIAALLYLVVEPKISTRLRAILPRRRTVNVSLAWLVRALGTAVVLVVAYFVTAQIPVGLFAVITLAGGLQFLIGLFAVLAQQEPPADRGERLRRWGGIALVLLGMAMTFGGSFGVSLLFDFPHETGTRGLIMQILFGPVYYLGLPVFLLGLWLLGAPRRHD